MKHSIKYVLLGLLFFFIGSMSYAQITTSSLGGRIIDQKGEPVVGAAIIATHLPSGTTYAAVTNIDGRYTIQGMRPGGPYKVEISSLGYQSITYKDITLKLGELYDLNGKIKESSENLKESVVVATPKSKFAVEKTGASTNISSSQIQDIPTVNRSISDVAKLSPYGGNGMSFAGGDGRSTNFTVDGANFNNNFGLTPGLPGGGSPISLDAISEMQVVISPYDVRQSNFIGGGINAITKSGTNTLKGSAYIYHKNENMRGNRIANQELSPREIDRTTTYGATLGGPIVKNKLFYFVNFEYVKSPSSANLWRPSDNGVGNKDLFISRTTKADMEKVSKYLKDTYGYDPGSYSNYPGGHTNIKFLTRIDWNINTNNHLSVRYNYTINRGWRPTNGSSGDFNGGTRLSYNRLSEFSMAFANSMYSMDNKVNSIAFDLNSRFGQNISNQLLVTYSKIDDVRGTNSKRFPFVDIMAGTKLNDAGKMAQILEPYMSFGYELFTWNNGVHNNILNAKDDITYYLDNHKITAGVSIEHQMADNSYMREGTGYYRYRSVEDFLNQATPETVAITYGYGGNTKPAARVTFNQIGVYAQDDWNVTDKLKVNLGLRLDTIIYDNKDIMTNNAVEALDFHGKHIDTGKWPTTNVQFSPRFGFTWDVFGNKTLKVRGGTGLFAGRLPLVFFTNMPTNSGMVQNARVAVSTRYNPDGTIKDYDKELDQFAGPLLTNSEDIVKKLNSIDPKKYPTDITPDDGVIPSGGIDVVDSNFKMPQVWKSSIAIDYQLPTDFPFSITGEFIFNKNINNTVIKDWSMADNNGWARFNGADRRHIYPNNIKGVPPISYTGKDGKPAKKPVPSTFVLTNTHKGYGWTGNITVNAQPIPSLSLMASYTHTVSKEVTGMPGNAAISVFQGLPTVEGPNFATLQNSQYVMPDRVIASFTYRDKGNNQYSLFYQGAVYTGYSYMYNGDMNGDGVANDLIYIPKDDSEILFASKKDHDNYWAFANQDAYLKSHRGQYAEAYSVHAPMVHTFDFRFAHDIKLKVGKSMNTLRLSVDCMNIGNMLNSNWGVSRVFSDGASYGRILKLDSVNEKGVPVYKTMVPAGAKTWDLLHTTGNCWYLQLGIKYMFN